jgi:PPK2 family polyphosphate:nucleotide phosphotransferase
VNAVTGVQAAASLMAGIDCDWKIDPDSIAADIRLASSVGQSADGAKQALKACREAIKPLQETLMAGRQQSILMIFQALDAAGKDGAIREVLEGLNPAGIEVSSFKAPSQMELRHDFLWRTSQNLPPRGVLGVFNRSYYEEVLVVRVHPEYLGGQFTTPPDPDALWPERYRAIREHERHLCASSTIVLKFWLNVSPGRQARRFLDRLQDPEKHWKFSRGDLAEADLRPAYDEAVAEMLAGTSTSWAPWFVIPADERWYARWQIADVLRQALDGLRLTYPAAEVTPEEATQLAAEIRHDMGDDPEPR